MVRSHQIFSSILKLFLSSYRCQHVCLSHQGSFLEQILFNVSMIHPIYECKDSNVASYADGTVPHSCAADIPSV